jgi:hypothetical protein
MPQITRKNQEETLTINLTVIKRAVDFLTKKVDFLHKGVIFFEWLFDKKIDFLHKGVIFFDSCEMKLLQLVFMPKITRKNQAQTLAINLTVKKWEIDFLTEKLTFYT